MNPEIIARLKKAIEGRKCVDEFVGRIHSCAYVDVMPSDIIALSAGIDNDRARALNAGCTAAIGQPLVAIKAADLAYLLDEASKAPMTA